MPRFVNKEDWNCNRRSTILMVQCSLFTKRRLKSEYVHYTPAHCVRRWITRRCIASCLHRSKLNKPGFLLKHEMKKSKERKKSVNNFLFIFLSLSIKAAIARVFSSSSQSTCTQSTTRFITYTQQRAPPACKTKDIKCDEGKKNLPS